MFYLFFLFIDNLNMRFKRYFYGMIRYNSINVGTKKHVQFCWLLQYSKHFHLFSNIQFFCMTVDT